MQGYSPPNEPASEYQTIPLSKIEDFGVHAKHYYSLDVTFFKSSMDEHLLGLLWNKYWVNTLSSSPLVNTRDLVCVSRVEGLCEYHRSYTEGQILHHATHTSQCPTQACRIVTAVGPILRHQVLYATIGIDLHSTKIIEAFH